jgi:hypothetical protein
MDKEAVSNKSKQSWVEPEIRELAVQQTFAQPGGGADVGGNPFPDCQAS